jgi:hypothetical protein
LVLPSLAAIALVLTLVGPMRTLAQDASPVPVTAESHPAHIHDGTCDNLGGVAYPLNDVTLAPAAGEATPTAQQPMMAHADEVLTSVTTVDVSLTDLLAGQYAINIHESADQIQNYIACGDIAGQIRLHLRSDAPPGLVIPLRELNDSGYAGVAWLEPTADGKTTVTIFLASGLIGRGPQP